MLDPRRMVDELKELRALTADGNGAQSVAWSDSLVAGAGVVCIQTLGIARGASSGRGGISHNKIENTREEHLEMAVVALDRRASLTMEWVSR